MGTRQTALRADHTGRGGNRVGNPLDFYPCFESRGSIRSDRRLDPTQLFEQRGRVTGFGKPLQDGDFFAERLRPKHPAGCD